MQDGLYLGDCISYMQEIEDKSIDCIICDLPYGITGIKWDCAIDFDILWREYSRIIKDCGNILLFSSGLFTIDLINYNRKWFKYKLIWN